MIPQLEMPVDAEAGVDRVDTLPQAVKACAPSAHVLLGALHGGATESHPLAWADLSEIIEREWGDDGQDGVPGGDSTSAVQDQELIAGRDLHSADGNTAGDHLLGTAADRELTGHAQPDVVALRRDGVRGLEEASAGALELPRVGAVCDVDQGIVAEVRGQYVEVEQRHVEVGVHDGSDRGADIEP